MLGDRPPGRYPAENKKDQKPGQGMFFIPGGLDNTGHRRVILGMKPSLQFVPPHLMAGQGRRNQAVLVCLRPWNVP